jgi:hypothetical protein
MRVLIVLRRNLGNERGISLIATGMWIMAFFALTAVGVDVARIAFTATEVQTTAEVGVTAAVTSFFNGKATGASETDGNTVVANNTVSGSTAANPTYTWGNVNAAGAWTVGGAPTNAAEATATTNVNNLFAGIIGFQQATVRKTARATAATISSDNPTLPMALDQTCFDNQNCTADATQCPLLSTFSNSACWTGFTQGANDSTIDGLVPTTSGCSGGAGSLPFVSVGNSINMTNGTLANVYRDVLCYWCANPNAEFVVPVFNDGTCGGSCPGSQTVTGFATVKIAAFTDKDGNVVAQVVNGSPTGCGSNPKGIKLQSFRNLDEPGGVGGCVKCGTGFVRLVG